MGTSIIVGPAHIIIEVCTCDVRAALNDESLQRSEAKIKVPALGATFALCCRDVRSAKTHRVLILV